MPRCRHADRNAAETNTLPWSMTMVSGTITGLAAACSSRSSIASSRSYGSTEWAIFNASGHPGRKGSGVRERASRTLASTDRVDGRSTAAGTTRVATSIMPVSSTRPGTPSSSSTRTSSGVESICTTSPGAAAGTDPNMPSGRPASDRRVDADPVVCRPCDRVPNSR